MLKKYKGKLVAPKIIEIDLEYENIFIEKLKKITPLLEIEKIFRVKGFWIMFIKFFFDSML